MAQLRGSNNYVWSINDTLGSGATGAVFKARHKKTGELYAVKTFNDMSAMRPVDVQMREFDVLRRLQHENIVRLLAIEKESQTQKEVLVMELCTGGSLFNMLDDPQNAFGVEEKEFISVLADVASGMKHLYNQGIVHRDIKPGNIMRYIREDGRSVYKLIDFGAARELQNEEQFLSLYGTEEYLFPDMYERAVLRRQSGKTFSAVVDLWSIGVTLYHVATGQLPFRPFGGRKNKETMHRITTEKAAGVISGVQNTEGGDILWSKHLPVTCRLSLGLKKQLTPLLAGLLECDPDQMLTFEKFFSQVQSIASKMVVHVFSTTVTSCAPLSIYIDPTARLTQFQELVAEQTDIAAQDQQLLFENHDLEKLVKAIQPVNEYPQTFLINPIYLYTSSQLYHSTPPQSHSTPPLSTNTDPRSLEPIAVIPEMPLVPVTTGTDMDADVILAKNFCAVAHQTLRLISGLITQQQLVSRAAKMFLLVLLRETEHVRDVATEFFSLVEETNKRVSVLVMCQQALGNTSAELQELAEKFRDISDEVRTMKQCIDDQYNKLNSSEPSLSVTCLEQSGCREEHRCVTKGEILLNALQTTLDTFKKDRGVRRLSFNDEQIHKFDKHKMKLNGARLTTIVSDHCLPNTQKVFTQFHIWFAKVCKIQDEVEHLKNRLISANDDHTALTMQLDQIQSSTFGNKATTVSENPRAAFTLTPPVGRHFEGSGSTLTTLPTHMTSVAEISALSTEQLVNQMDIKLEESGRDMEAINDLVRDNLVLTQELERLMTSRTKNSAAEAQQYNNEFGEPQTLTA